MTPALEVDVSGRASPSKILDTGTIDAVIDSLLDADPPPYVMAAAENGIAVPLPAGVPLDRAFAVDGVASALELCLEADATPIVEAWARARVQRGAQTVVHLRREPEQPVTLHFVDARHRFGVYLAIFVGSSGVFHLKQQGSNPFRPRVFRMERDEVSVIHAIDPVVARIIGWEPAELLGARTSSLTHPDDLAVAIANWMEMLSRPGQEQRVTLRLRHRDGHYIWFEVTNRNLLNDPDCGRVLTEVVDISERMETLESLRANEQLLRRLAETLPLGVLQIDAERRIVYRNELLLLTLGTGTVETIAAQFAHIAEPDRATFDSALGAVLARGESADFELGLDCAAGFRRCGVTMRALCGDGGDVSGAILCVSDVTERARLREELERRAHFDHLTNCYNRASILEALDTVLAQPRAVATGMAVVFVDLDRFKEVNDRYGHAVGDELLRLTGERLHHAVRAGDVVGRLGGDEFLVVCPDVASPAHALDIAQRIAATLQQSARLGSASIVPGSSIGVAWTDRRIGGEVIVARADAAMYESKRCARGPVLALR